MDFDQVAGINRCVDLRGRNVGMPQQCLDVAQIRAALEEMRGKRMTENVRTDLQLDTGGPGVL